MASAITAFARKNMIEALKPKVAVLKADGTNCDRETKYAFNLVGGDAETVLLTELLAKEKSLLDYQILTIPGGFSFGDDFGSGKFFALYLSEQLNEYYQRTRGIITGQCNGMQVMMQAGLLPFGEIGNMGAALDNNLESNGFYHDEVTLKVEENHRFPALKGLEGSLIFKTAHGEGNFSAPPATIQKIEEQGLVVMRYANPITGESTQAFPYNPNGSENAIAGITDPSGRSFGLMPHWERVIKMTQLTNWRRMPRDRRPDGLEIPTRIVDYAKQAA